MNIERNRKFLEDMKELRKSILYERLIFFPIKLGLAYFVYSHFETGIFWILAYLIYCVGDTAKILFVNIRELQALIEKYDADLNERVTSHLQGFASEIQGTETLSTDIMELKMRIEDLEK